MSEEISNQTLHALILDIKDDTKEIKAGQKITNGRVTRLEGWRYFYAGGLAILTILVVPILITLVTKVWAKQ